MSLLTSCKGVHQKQIVKSAIDNKSHHFGYFELNWRIIANFQSFIYDYISSDFSTLINKFWGPGTNKPLQCPPKNLLEVAWIQKVI